MVGSTHDPLQSSDVAPLHPSPHVPLVHVAIPPESGPSHTLLHVPQCAGFVGSTHVPLHSSVVGAEHPPSTCPSVAPSLVLPLSFIGEDESPVGPPSPSPSTLESPMPEHVLVSEHVPNVSVPHPAAHTPSPASPTQIPNVTA